MGDRKGGDFLRGWNYIKIGKKRLGKGGIPANRSYLAIK